MATLEVNLEALKHNYMFFADAAEQSKCGAVVKANAYGLGVEQVSLALAAQGCESFFVAHIEEAVELRNILNDNNYLDKEVYVFNGVSPGGEKPFLDNKIIPVLNNYPQLQAWRLNGKNNPCAVHIDTAMNRLGFDGMPPLGNINCKMVMSHLANAEDKKHPINKRQLEFFKNLNTRFSKFDFSLCNSAAVVLGKDYHFDLLRPGIGLYGGLDNKNTKDVVTLKAKIIQIREISENLEVGYGSTYKAKKGDIIATLDIGYADGISRLLSNKGKAYIGKTSLPYAGRVSMDLITIDITKLDKKYHKVGQEVEILGNNYNIRHMAKDCGTISYEIITSLGQRFKREYVNA